MHILARSKTIEYQQGARQAKGEEKMTSKERVNDLALLNVGAKLSVVVVLLQLAFTALNDAYVAVVPIRKSVAFLDDDLEGQIRVLGELRVRVTASHSMIRKLSKQVLNGGET